MALTKKCLKEAEEFKSKSFVPRGKRLGISINKLIFRRTTESEVLRCHKIVGDDPQCLGPSYCGDLAEFTTTVIDDTGSVEGTLSFCELHSPPAELIKDKKDYDETLNNLIEKRVKMLYKK